MMHFDLNAIVRENIRNLVSSQPARSRSAPGVKIFLDENENAFGSPLTKWYNRYPDALQKELKQKISAIKKIPPEQMVLANGTTECISLLLQAFCDPGKDEAIVCPPCAAMYPAAAAVHGLYVKEVPLTPQFNLDLEALERAIATETKIIFLCSPNNPTGNSLEKEEVELVLNNFEGIVVVDEAYVNYSRHRSFLAELSDYPNLVVLQTFSKAWGLAGLRLAMVFASAQITDVLNRIRHPYAINSVTQELATQALDGLEAVNQMILETIKERGNLAQVLAGLGVVKKVFPSEANFLLVRVENAGSLYAYLSSIGILVADCSHEILCENCLRITVGTAVQNRLLIETMAAYKTNE